MTTGTKEWAEAVAKVQRLQKDREILRLYHLYQGDAVIRWKDSIRKVVGHEIRQN